jgi:hypothetical protein
MKQLIHNFFSGLLAIIVLFSTLSFRVDSHVAVFSEVRGCGMEMENEMSDEVSFFKKPCCKNETSIVEGNSIDQQVLKNLKLQQIDFVTAFVVSYNNLFLDNTQTSLLYLYKPPLIHKDIILLFENFRI